MVLVSRLIYGSYFAYTPRPTTYEQQLSKDLMYKIKNEKPYGNPPEFFSEYFAKVITQEQFPDFFGEDVSLVPVPKSSLMQEDSLWVPDRIAKALANNGRGTYFNCLQRIKGLPKAALAKAEDRPKPIDHYKTISYKKSIYQPKKILLIDDVVTRGATLLGCASVLKEFFPNIPINGFVVMRTISNNEEFKNIVDPLIGEIELRNGETHRKGKRKSIHGL